jgi:hypothetical protein
MKLENKVLFWTGLGHFFNHVGNYLTPALLIYLQTDINTNRTRPSWFHSNATLSSAINRSRMDW